MYVCEFMSKILDDMHGIINYMIICKGEHSNIYYINCERSYKVVVRSSTNIIFTCAW